MVLYILYEREKRIDFELRLKYKITLEKLMKK